ncbi:Phosphoglycolate phosphatase [Rubripirellula obstinata]|uniref:Phosphoglycolate phosphatase n=1 Tax=Rubripirellula obstinata TaxID=406547 RepID=A0A5B1CK67_9BACT|nr:HAD family hydrolase [Rubripirellula obstinata]KAA1259940.1 Phosphoglycolate phosphatase [Rubripirellula obstinata]
MNRSSPWIDQIVQHRAPLQPIPTDIKPKLVEIPAIRAVIFDVYGTLVVSGSGDVGSADVSQSTDHISDAFQACGVSLDSDSTPTLASLKKLISETNLAAKSDACPKPEVDIVDIWRRLLTQHGLTQIAGDTEQVVRIATAYEARANPTWPMPGAAELLAELKSSGKILGIVSNAQVFTPALVEEICDAASLEEAGFQLDLSLFSNRFRQSKPGPRLFEVLVDSLARRKILPQEAIYVGNDMLNDVYAASVAGLRTAWFVGDARSCRPRTDDVRCQNLQPDLVLTNLPELPNCLRLH